MGRAEARGAKVRCSPQSAQGAPRVPGGPGGTPRSPRQRPTWPAGARPREQQRQRQRPHDAGHRRRAEGRTRRGRTEDGQTAAPRPPVTGLPRAVPAQPAGPTLVLAPRGQPFWAPLRQLPAPRSRPRAKEPAPRVPERRRHPRRLWAGSQGSAAPARPGSELPGYGVAPLW